MKHPKGKALIDKVEDLFEYDDRHGDLSVCACHVIEDVDMLFSKGERIPAEDVKKIEILWEQYIGR